MRPPPSPPGAGAPQPGRSVFPSARALRIGLARAIPAAGPLDLRHLGRTLLHAAVLGGVAGLVGAGFFAALDVGQRLLLEGLAGYAPLRAAGESLLHSSPVGAFRPWALALLPAAGGLASGLLTWRFAPECAGGGGDATIDGYHRHGARMRARVVPVKGLASLATLATGGAGGREGPTMQIGAALGALIGRWLPTTARERRVLFVAGIAAGISAVFRTPLGAALLAVEMLYRDDFESDAIVPSILASVVSYSVATSLFGETTLFGRLPRFPFVVGQLPLYALLAVAVSLAGVAFAGSLRATSRAFARLPGPVWLRPAVGGLAMGAFATAVVLASQAAYGAAGRQAGVFGGGYGALQAAIDGSPGLPRGWALVAILALLAAAKLVAASLTIGSGAAAGDFAPSLAIGGLLGAAFGHGAALALGDPAIQPTAFVLVGMGTFYGGLAHTPLAALVLVSELAGSYDLLVPMMLSIAIAFVALRRWSLYPAQPATTRDSPLHAGVQTFGALTLVAARGAMRPPEVAPVAASTRLPDALRAAEAARAQRVVPVVGPDGRPTGLLELEALRAAASDPNLAWALAADASAPWAAVAPETALSAVALLLAEQALPEVPVVEAGEVVGYVGEPELARAILAAAGAAPDRRRR